MHIAEIQSRDEKSRDAYPIDSLKHDAIPFPVIQPKSQAHAQGQARPKAQRATTSPSGISPGKPNLKLKLDNHTHHVDTNTVRSHQHHVRSRTSSIRAFASMFSTPLSSPPLESLESPSSGYFGTTATSDVTRSRKSSAVTALDSPMFKPVWSKVDGTASPASESLRLIMDTEEERMASGYYQDEYD